MRKALPKHSKVKFDIGQGLDTGTAVIKSILKDPDNDCLYYELVVIEGSKANMHRNGDGELWVNAFEVKPVK